MNFNELSQIIDAYHSFAGYHERIENCPGEKREDRSRQCTPNPVITSNRLSSMHSTSDKRREQ